MNVFYIALFMAGVLQILISTPYGAEWGVREFFVRHGVLEGLFVFASMSLCIMHICKTLFDDECGYTYAIVCGALMDMFLRLSRVMPSLDPYFKNNSPFLTILVASAIVSLLKTFDGLGQNF